MEYFKERFRVLEVSLYINIIVTTFFRLLIYYYDEVQTIFAIISLVIELILVINASIAFFFKDKFNGKVYIFDLALIAEVTISGIMSYIGYSKGEKSNFFGPLIILSIANYLSVLLFLCINLNIAK